MSTDNKKPWEQVMSDLRRHYIDFMLNRFHQTDEMANALAENDEEKVANINCDWTQDFLQDYVGMGLDSPFKVESDEL